MTALSLFEDDTAGLRDEAMDPDVVRPARPVFRNVDHRGTTIPALVLAVLMVTPGIWRYAQDELTFSVLLQRFVLIALACVAVLEVVRRYVSRAVVDPDGGDGVDGVDGAEVATMALEDTDGPWGDDTRGSMTEQGRDTGLGVPPAAAAAIDAGLDPALALLAGER